MVGHHWIAMLDILGFRRMIQTRSLKDLALDVDHLFAAAEPKEAVRVSRSPRGRHQRRSLTLGHLHFGDTIMLWTPPLDPADGDINVHAFFHIRESVGNLIATALINGIPLRGGIAEGECYIDAAKQVIVGQAIVDAYLLEQEQEWLGAAINAEQFGRLARFEHLEEWSSIVQYPVPTKASLPAGQLLAVDWTGVARMPEAASRRFLKIDARLAIEQALIEGAQRSAGTSAQRKWENTGDFYRVQMQRQTTEWIAIRPKKSR